MTYAYVFPGAGMAIYSGLRSFYEDNILMIRPRIEEASMVAGTDLMEFVCLKRHEQSGIEPQLFYYAFSCAMFDVVKQRGVPKILAGYSMGVFAALYASGSLDFQDGIRMLKDLDIMATRAIGGRQYSMSAVLGMRQTEIESVILRMSDEVEVINQNGVESFVLCGEANVMEKLIRQCEREGGLVTRLPVLLPYHTQAMWTIKKVWAEYVDNYRFSHPALPLLSATNNDMIIEAEGCRRIVLTDMFLSFSWLNTIRKIAGLGIRDFVECGPSVSLSKMGRFIDFEHAYHNIKTFSTQGLSR